MFYLFLMLSIWIVVGVTIDRYLLIVRQIRMSVRAHAACLAGLVAGGFIINFPHFFNHEPVQLLPEEVPGQSDSDDPGWRWNTTAYGNSESVQR